MACFYKIYVHGSTMYVKFVSEHPCTLCAGTVRFVCPLLLSPNAHDATQCYQRNAANGCGLSLQPLLQSAHPAPRPEVRHRCRQPPGVGALDGVLAPCKVPKAPISPLNSTNVAPSKSHTGCVRACSVVTPSPSDLASKCHGRKNWMSRVRD